MTIRLNHAHRWTGVAWTLRRNSPPRNGTVPVRPRIERMLGAPRSRSGPARQSVLARSVIAP
jgi:hypothetical protein